MSSSCMLGVALLLWPVTPTAADGPFPPHGLAALVGEAVAATEARITPGALHADVAAVQTELARIIGRMGPGPASYVRARRLHRLLHRRYLAQYRRDADSLTRLFDRGEFNCLSATLLYGLVARELGYRVVVIERPGHLLLALDLDGRRVMIETTSVGGFDRHPPGADPSSLNLFGLERAAATGGDPTVIEREFPLEAMIGFAWLNAAWRDLEAGRPRLSSRRVDRARGFLPYVAGTDDARRILARAFHGEYESARFESALEIARIEFGMWPQTTTARERLLAAAVKRIEEVCDADLVVDADRIAREVTGSASGADVRRFEQRVWPLVAASAVRLSDWGLAERSAERYARVEPDRVEARRLLDWVAERRDLAGQRSSSPVCEEHPTRADTSTSRR